MNNIRLIHGSNTSGSSHSLLVNSDPTITTNQVQQQSQSILSHNLQLSHAASTLHPHNVALQPFATPNAYAFAYNPEHYLQHNHPSSYVMCRTGVHPEYNTHELYTTPETMLAQPSHGSAFLLGQPMQTSHLAPTFQGFQLKQESEPEPSSDESNFGEHGGVIRKAERIKNSKGFSANKISAPDLQQAIERQQNCANHFCYVPGRLSLLSSAAKYEVTIDEIGRRISPPESLNASVLGSILRRAKSKDGGKSLRDKLKNHGLILPAGRRKANQVNALTALVEHEASVLATDFEKLCSNEFPSKEMATFLTRLHADSNSISAEQRKNRKNLMHMTKQLISEFCEVLSKDGSPLCNTPTSHTLDPIIQKPLSHFSLVTHGFGGRAINSGLQAFSNYLDESIKILDAK